MRALLILLVTASLFACTREPTRWDTTQNVPLVKADLSLDDLIEDSLIQVNADQTVGIRLRRELLSFRVDSLVKIPSDTIERAFTIAPLAEFTLNPGQTFYQTDDNFEFDNMEAQLSQAIIKAGILHFHAENTIPSPLDFLLSIPGASIDGEPLQIEATVPPSSSGENGMLDLDVDLSDYSLDLTGADGFGYNMLTVNFSLTIPDEGGTVVVFNDDFVNMQLTYAELEVAYARGYLGTLTDDINQSTTLSDFKNFNEAILDIQNSSAEIKFSNGFGVDIQAEIFQIKGWNTSKNTALALTGSFIGNTINLSRATYSNGRILPFDKTYQLDNGNSNLDAMLELLPDSLRIRANIAVNPFGNISNYNDFVSYHSKITASLDAYIPLSVGLSGLALRDTATFEFGDDKNVSVKSGKLYLAAGNGFPVNISLSLKALNANNEIVLDLDNYAESDFIAGRTDSVPVQSIVQYNINEAVMTILKDATKIAIKADFETTNYPDRMTFTNNDSLRILISSDINATFNF